MTDTAKLLAPPLVTCAYCNGKGHRPGDPEGAPIEDCQPCKSSGKRPIRMEAYYYSFASTGVPAIDVILSAVACAGKAYHHTDDWGDNSSPYHELHRGECPVDWIQNAADDAAKSILTARQVTPTRELMAERLYRTRNVGAEAIPAVLMPEWRDADQRMREPYYSHADAILALWSQP